MRFHLLSTRVNELVTATLGTAADDEEIMEPKKKKPATH